MKIRVADIRGGEVFRVSEMVSSKDLGFTNEYDLKFDEDFTVNAEIERVSSVLIAKAEVSAKLSTVCSRCLEPLVLKWKRIFAFDFPVDQSTQFVEMNEDIRQEVLLNLPLKLLCKEECKGICPDCGSNLNLEECKCSTKTPDT